MMIDSGNSSSEDDFYEGLLKKAVDVKMPVNFDPNSIPQSGEEYLQHVMYERTKCKKTVTASKDFTYLSKNQTFRVKEKQTYKSEDKHVPTLEWQSRTLEDYMDLKKYIEMNSKIEPTKTNIIVDIPHGFQNFSEYIKSKPPAFSKIIEYNQGAKLMILQEISRMFEDSFDLQKGLPENIGSWVYAVLVLLQKPLSPDCCYNLREFAKKCHKLRAMLDDNVSETVYKPLNVYICIISKYFNQLDLADYP